MKRKILLSPLLIIVFIIVFGVTAAGAAILLGGGTQGETNTQSINLQKGLIGWWKFDGNAKDATLYANNGTVTGAVLTTDRKGQVDKVYSFDGATDRNDYIELGDPSVLEFGANQDFTISLWLDVVPHSVAFPPSYEQVLVVKGTRAGGSDLILQVNNNDAGTLKAGSDAWTGQLPASAGLASGGWHHVAVVVDADGNTTSYVDGSLDGSAVSTGGTLSSANTWLIGDPASAPDGKIDDVKFYNRVLSTAEITALYEEYDPGIVISDLQKGLVGNWDMNGNAKDKTMYANNGTVTGAVLANDRKGQANKAYSFDGTDYIDVGTDIFNSQSQGSINVWINIPSKPAATAGTNIIGVASTTGANNLWGFGLYSPSTDDTRIRVGYNSPAGNYVYGSTSLAVDTWYLVTLIGNGSAWTMYVNGSLESLTIQQGSNTGKWWDVPASGIMKYSIGVNHRSTGDLAFFTGSIDDFRIYNRALSATEITALYESYNPGVVVSDLQKGLVGNWDMNGNAKDKTMYANNGTVTGATLTTDRKGQVDKAYSFDAASSQYIDAGSGSSLDITGNITVSVWAKFSVSQTNRPLVGKWGTDQAYVLLIPTGSNDKINFSIRVSEVNKGATSSQTYNDGNWHHYVGVFNGVNVLLYVDGGAEAIVGDATTGPIDSPVSNSLTIGNYNNLPSGNRFSGSIDDVRIYNRALTATEVLALYESY